MWTRERVTELESRVSELENKVKKLDPENISEKVKQAIVELEQAKEDIKKDLSNVVEERTKVFSNSLDKLRKDLITTNTQLGELVTRVKDFISSSKETTQKIVEDIENMLKGLRERLAK